MQTINRQGNVIETWGSLPPEAVSAPVAVEAEKVQFTKGYGAIVDQSALEPRDISPLDVILGGEFGSVAVLAPARNRTDTPEIIRLVIGMDDLTTNARTMLFRTVAFAGGLLVVTLAGLWVLLEATRFQTTLRIQQAGTPDRRRCASAHARHGCERIR